MRLEIFANKYAFKIQILLLYINIVFKGIFYFLDIFEIIYNDGSNFAKLQRVLISIDDNLNFLINFMSAR